LAVDGSLHSAHAKDLWSRFTARRAEAAKEHEVEREWMTDAERRTDDETFEGRQSDLASQARVGGMDPERLLPDENPEHH
jgi:hypothetical protein